MKFDVSPQPKAKHGTFRDAVEDGRPAEGSARRGSRRGRSRGGKRKSKRKGSRR